MQLKLVHVSVHPTEGVSRVSQESNTVSISGQTQRDEKQNGL